MSILPNPSDPDYSDKLDALGVPIGDPRDELPPCDECKYYDVYLDECTEDKEDFPLCFEPIISAIAENPSNTGKET